MVTPLGSYKYRSEEGKRNSRQMFFISVFILTGVGIYAYKKDQQSHEIFTRNCGSYTENLCKNAKSDAPSVTQKSTGEIKKTK